VLIFNDITSVKRLLDLEFQHVKMQLRTSSVTHELITPLKCITSFAEELYCNVKRPLMKK